MSASAPSASPDITYITPEPFEPKPLIADILRTRFCVPDSIFLVEGIDIVHTSKSKRWRAIRLLLGDSDLCIQALLAPETHRFVDRDELAFGSYIKLQEFRVEWRDIPGGAGESTLDAPDSIAAKKAQMVYLIVDSLVVVGWHNALVDDPSMAGEVAIEKDSVDANYIEAAIVANEAPEESQDQPPSPESEKATSPIQTEGAKSEPTGHDGESVDIDDDFEVMDIPTNTITHNRDVVRTNTTTAATTSSERDTTTPPFQSNGPIRPVKLTTLRSIPNLPYKQNWSVNVLCVISAISEIEPAGIPPYTQRQARLADPSTDKHVLLTVFLDPHLFTPQVGNVVLLLGVKNHRFDGGSLKKYASNRPKDGGSWWCEDPAQSAWCDADGLRRWWARSQATG
ncbi:hypothetical protein F4678DRAFT_359407 [Xylaria arbuscula]|nr:hypothetical protein F4678DRAFT_359407 [Xylaria arbuscula]